MRKLILAASVFIAVAIQVNAQKISFENVAQITLRNAGAVKQAEQVKGYYFFYETDRINRKINEYTLQITDEKLKKLKEVKFQDKEGVAVNTSSFNGSDLMILFHHTYDGKVSYKIFGADGNAKWDYEKEIELPSFLPPGMPPEMKQTIYNTAIGNIYPIEGEGFVSKRGYKGERSFELDFYSSKTKKTWTYMPTGAKYFSGTYLGANRDFILLSVNKHSGIMDRNPDITIVGLDIQTGKVLFEKPCEQPAYKFLPSVMYRSEGASQLVVGEYFDAQGSVYKDKSLGLALWEIDGKGNITKQKQTGWATVFNNKFTVNEKGKIEGFGYLFIHDVIRLKDGNIHVIGEGYTTGGKTYTTDMMALQFNPELDLLNMQLFEKQKNPVDLHGTGTFMSTQSKGYLMKSEDKFDYSSLQKNGANNSYSIYYSNYVRGKSYTGGTYNSITFADNKFTSDKINTDTKATLSAILPAVQGQILMLDYYRKDKRLDIHFEKMN